SIIFTPFFSDVRHLMLCGGTTAATLGAIPAHLEVLMRSLSHSASDFDADHGLSYLHLAVVAGDIPLAYEALRLGTPVYFKNKAGYSPLYFGCDLLLLAARSGGIPAPIQAQWQTLKGRIVQICLFFVAHHSDPNETHGTDISVLSLACITRSWELIRALLLHGATPDGLTQIFHHQPADKTRFEKLVSELSSAVRPARICPCGSSRLLKDCHQTSQPRPGHFLCPCQSRKTYAACCSKKNIEWSDHWDEKEGLLGISRVLCRSAQAAHAGLGAEDIIRAMDVAGVTVPAGPRALSQIDKPNEAILKVLIEERRIDPAYAAACKKTMIAPSPAAVLTVPKLEWIQSMRRWNDDVDAYIAFGVDRRAPEIIEGAAKVGVAGGPLWRRCEAPRCIEVENKDSVKPFPQCSAATRFTVYCSQTCQKTAWKGHKSACRAGEVVAQMLPSQVEYMAELRRFGGFTFL
ncbi:hypothetical protein C8R47DRAFT_987204, partial [Mycena vitilis]